MAQPAVSPEPPTRIAPSRSWEHYDLWIRVRDALRALPDYFTSETNIEGMLATDIFSLNAPLGTTIEEQVVATLNLMRPVWDPMRQYQTYSFIRQTQTFPDVLLRKQVDGQDVIMGIELKGWYLLAKEGAPSYRFTVSPDACTEADLLVVVPWVLSNVLAGKPITYQPFIELARYAAESRNYYWEHIRKAKGDRTVVLAQGVGPYPVKSDKISDRAASDSGSNFGRIARYGIMDEYMEATRGIEVRGVPAKDWSSFFKTHSEGG